MNILLILLVFVLIIYYINKNRDGFHQDIRAKYKPKKNTDYLNDLLKYTNDNHSLYSEDYDMEFVEAQFHTDYRDTITAFNNIAPAQKQIFNIANLPVQFSNPEQHEVKKLISDFMTELNKNIINEVPDYRNVNSGWDEAVEDPHKESGWDRNMEALGLPKSLYPDPAKKSKVKLLKIDHVEKYESEDEIKYSVYLFLKKNKVEDVLVIKVSFVLDKRIVNEDRTFFNQNNNETHIVLEEIFMIGYMTERGVGRTNDFRDKFYNFNDLEKDGILDDNEIIRQLNHKLAERHKETQRFNDTLEPQFRSLKVNAPHLSNSKSYQATRTIYDDLTQPRIFS
jgi:hypothetical protein